MPSLLVFLEASDHIDGNPCPVEWQNSGAVLQCTKLSCFLLDIPSSASTATLQRHQATRKYKAEAEILPILFNVLTLLLHLFPACKLMKQDHAGAKKEKKKDL